jgi:hypothetical protein
VAGAAKDAYNSEEAAAVAEAARSAGAAAWSTAKGIEVPEVQFDVTAARKALTGATGNAFEVVSQAATGCKAFALDMLKVEIFRDFFQFMGIFFASLRMPESFRAVFGNVAAFASASVQSLLRGYADLPAIYWFLVFMLLALVFWTVLGVEMRGMTDLQLRFQADRQSKDAQDWTEINRKDGGRRFKKVKYIMLLLMTIYVPVTRNSFQMVACADKYAFDQYRCEPNGTDQGVFYVYDQRGGFAGATKCTCADPAQCAAATASTETPTGDGSKTNVYKMFSQNYIQLDTGSSCTSKGYHRITSATRCAEAARELGLGDQFISSADQVNTSLRLPGCSYEGNTYPTKLQWNHVAENSNVPYKSCGTAFVENGGTDTTGRINCVCAKTALYGGRRRLGYRAAPGDASIVAPRHLPESSHFRRRLNTTTNNTSGTSTTNTTNAAALPAFDCFRDAPEAPEDAIGGKTILVNTRPFCGGCYNGGHLLFSLLSIFLLVFYSFAFPKLLARVITSMIPKAISPEDPENPVFSPPLGKAGDAAYDKEKKLYDELHGKPVIFDDEGHLVEFTDKMFVNEVRKQKDNPYSSLYSGFEMKWAHYKTVIMWMKMLQILPTVVVTSVVVKDQIPNKGKLAPTIAGLMAAAIMGVFLSLALKASPYVDRVNDRMDHVSRLVLFVTPCMAVAATWTGASLEWVWALALNAASFASAAFSVSATFYVMSCCQTKIKTWTGGLKWSDPDGISNWQDSKTLPDWNLDTERKRRIWKPFWDRLFTSDPELSGISAEEQPASGDGEGEDGDDDNNNNNNNNQKKKKKKKKKNKKNKRRSLQKMVDGTLCPWPKMRLDEMLEKLRERGFDAWEGGLMPVTPEIANMRAMFQTMFEGPDIWCDDKWTTDTACSLVKDGHLDSGNGFGRLEVDVFPYTLKIFWDGKASHDWGEIPSWGHHAPRMQELWNKQLLPDVQRMKGVRQQLRGCACSGETFHLVQQYVENLTRSVPDGKDAEGNQKYRTEHYKIEWTFTNGTVRVCGDFGDSEWEQGFNVSMTYNDGVGVELGGQHAGQTHHKSQTFGADAMGVNHGGYVMTPELAHLLGRDADGPNRTKCEAGYQKYLALLKEQRAHLLQERLWDNFALSWAFWYHVYNNDTQTKQDLNRYFNSPAELNPVVRNIPTKYHKELTAVLAMTHHFNQNPGIAYWYVYWHDLWENNSDLGPIKKNDHHFDSCNPKALCYRPMTRPQLEVFLEKECTPPNPLGKKQSFQLDLLYAAIDAIYEKHPNENRTTKKTVFVDFASSPVNPAAKLEISIVTEYEGNTIAGGSIEVIVPAGMAPGSTINVNVPSGKTVTVTIPSGAGPGSKFKVAY